MNLACSCNDAESITFYSNYRGSLSTLNPNLNEVYKRDYKGYYVDKNHSEKVNNFTNGPIEVIGKKMDTIIFEVSVVRKVVEEYMESKNYYKLYDNNLNAIYCRDKEDYELFISELYKLRNTELVSVDTGHPLEN